MKKNWFVRKYCWNMVNSSTIKQGYVGRVLSYLYIFELKDNERSTSPPTSAEDAVQSMDILSELESDYIIQSGLFHQHTIQAEQPAFGKVLRDIIEPSARAIIFPDIYTGNLRANRTVILPYRVNK